MVVGGMQVFVQRGWTPDYFQTGAVIANYNYNGNGVPLKYLGCYCDDEARAMKMGGITEQKALNNTNNALAEAYQFCVVEKKRAYFSVQISTTAYCSDHVRAFTHPCRKLPVTIAGVEYPGSSDYGKRPDAECKSDLYYKQGDDKINNGEGGGGSAWRNSIYMAVGTTEQSRWKIKKS